MKYVIIAIALVLALTGCATVRTVDPAETARFSEINTRAQRQKARVTLADGAPLMVSSLQVTPDSTSWLNPYTDRVENVATGEIREVTFLNRGRGALEGAGIGLLIGVPVGAVVAARSRGDPVLGGVVFLSFAPWEDIIRSAVPGGLLGLFVGAHVGHRATYWFDVPAIEPQVASGEGQSIVLKKTPRRKP